MTAYVTIPEGGADGVLACFGGEFGGWSLYLKDDKLHYAHNYLKTKGFTSVTHEYESPFEFAGNLRKVTIELK